MVKIKVKKTLRNKMIYSDYLLAKESGVRGAIEDILYKWEKKAGLGRVQLYNIIKGMGAQNNG